MIKKLIRRIKFYSQIRFFKYVYLNWFCKSVIRKDKNRIIPYKSAVIEIDPTAKIFLSGGDIEVGCDKVKGSKEETRVRLRQNAVWSASEGCRLSYGVTLEVLKDALLETMFFTMNSNGTIIAAKQISFGHDVMIGRNVVIYDSDFHSIFDQDSSVVNPPQPVIIGNHVWVGTNATILKGVELFEGSIVGAGTILSEGRYQDLVVNESKSIVLKKDRKWER